MKLQRIVPLIIFTLSSFMLWDAWQSSHRPALMPSETSSSTSLPISSLTSSTVPEGGSKAPAQPSNSSVAAPNQEMIHGQRIQVKTDLVEAEIDTAGGDLRDLRLLKQLSSDDDKPIRLFQDRADLVYVVQSGLLGNHLPNHTSSFEWIPSKTTLEPGMEGLDISLHSQVPGVAELTRTYHFKRGSYLIGVENSVRNLGSENIQPQVYYQFLRVSKAPPGDPRFVSTYTGPAVYTQDSKFKKISFSDIDKDKKNYPSTASNGWLAMLQHYFVAAWLPTQGEKREYFTRKVTNDLYSAGVIVPMADVKPGTLSSVTVPLYAGPQEGEKLKALAPGLELTIDYGWLTIIAVPIFSVLSWIHGWASNWGVAIILLTVSIKMMFFPLSAASYKSMARMRMVQPKMERIRQQYADDKARMNQAMMELYKTEKINPLGGCLPMVIQIPVFISLYWVLLGAVELRHAPFFGWIHDLSAADPFYILPLIMTASMLLQQRMSPKPADPVQAKVMQFMPLMFSFMFFFFPSGLVLYWVVNNLLSIAQQWQITRMMGDGKR